MSSLKMEYQVLTGGDYSTPSSYLDGQLSIFRFARFEESPTELRLWRRPHVFTPYQHAIILNPRSTGAAICVLLFT
jgi:hypothetical protein